METGERPFGSLVYPAMLDWIPMDVIRVVVKVGLISHEMLPKPALPQSTLAPFFSTIGYALAFLDGSGKVSFQQIPPDGEVRIAGRQRPNAM